MMHRPDINEYPPWLQEYIKRPMVRAMKDDENCINELKMVFAVKRTDPFAKVLFAVSVELIELQFEVWRLREEVEKRRIVLGSVTFNKREIAALKACAAQKMSEPTPEEEH